MNVLSLRGGGSGSCGGQELLRLTPHKLAVCQLIHAFAPPADDERQQLPVPFPFSSVAQHNRLGLFLLAITRSCNDFVEPPLEELSNQLKAANDGPAVGWLSRYLKGGLAALRSPDDLSNFVEKMKGVLASSEGINAEDDQILLDPNSQLGVYLRCCILAFNILSFEGVCHLLTNLAVYCSSTGPMLELVEEDNMDGSDLEILRSSYQLRLPEPLHIFVEENNLKLDDDVTMLRSRWQVEACLNQQADALEKDANSFPMESFGFDLTKLQNLAPGVNRVLYLQYLNALHHGDYIVALEYLHRYFDNSAGMQGLFGRSQSPPSEIIVGKYETALLCLGTLHSKLGHSKKALEAFSEAVRASQQNNDDSCLAYTLAAMSNLLSEKFISSNVGGIIDSPYSVGTSFGLGTPLSNQQQLLVLCQRSLKRASDLQLTSLLSFNHLSLAKFGLKHVKRSLLSFGPNACTTRSTSPVDVCKNLRFASRVLMEFGVDASCLQHDNGNLSTSWLKNLPAVSSHCRNNSFVKFQASINDFDTFHFDAQPNPVPGSVLQLAGSAYLLRATTWEHYGSASLVRTNALVFASCFADSASLSDVVLGYVKLIQHLATFKGHSEAFAALRVAESKFSSSNVLLQILKMQLLHERALHRGHLKVAQQICEEFGALASSVRSVDIELKIEAGLRHARTLLAAKQFGQAASVANSLFSTCYKHNMQVENASVLLLLAEIHKRSGNAVVGLPYALACSSFCNSFNLDLLESAAMLMIAELWLSLGPSHAKRASSLIRQALPMCLGHGGLELRARANIILAKCHFFDPAFSVSEDVSTVLEPLSQAADDLLVLEYHEMAAEAFYLKALVYNRLNKLDEREEAAASFREHILALENLQSEEVSLAY